MADNLSKEDRRYNMTRIKSTDTKPEEVVRKFLFSKGFRYRKNDKRLPGKPDIVLPKYKTVIFVHGCFWHGCPTCRHAKIRPVANAEYWDKKLDRTMERDKSNIVTLGKMGWHVMVIWECETRKNKLAMLDERIRKTLTQ